MKNILTITKDRNHIRINFLGIKLSVRDFVYIKTYNRFINKEVKPKTILIIEHNTSHFETITGLCKYCSELGYDVDVLTRESAEKIFENFKIKTLLRVFECDEIAFDKIYKEYDFSKYERIIYNSKRVYFGDKGTSPDGHDLFKYYNFARKGEKENIYLQHHIDRYFDTPNDIQIILANPAKLKDLDKFVVNCNYFKDFETQIKNKNEITNFISIGEISKQRRNISLLTDAVKMLHDSGNRNFKITIIGMGELEELPQDIRQYFNILGRVDYQTMFNELEDSDYILPLLDPTVEAHKRYMKDGTSGTFQLVYGFNKPCIVHKTFADIYNFDKSNSLIYEDNNQLCSAMKNAMNLDSETYIALQKNLINMTKKITEESLDNLRRILND